MFRVSRSAAASAEAAALAPGSSVVAAAGPEEGGRKAEPDADDDSLGSSVIGNVTGRVCVVVDDIIDSAYPFGQSSQHHIRKHASLHPVIRVGTNLHFSVCVSPSVSLKQTVSVSVAFSFSLLPALSVGVIKVTVVLGPLAQCELPSC